MKSKKIVGFAVLAMLALQSCDKKPDLERSETLSAQSNAGSIKSLASSIVSDYGTFTIQSNVGQKFIEVSGNPAYNEKYNNLAKLEQYAATGAGNLWQKWQVIYKKTQNGVKYYALMNLHSGKYLDIPNGSGTTGLQLQQWQNNGFDTQLFELRQVPGGYAIINKGNGLAVTNQNSSTNNGTAIVQETYSGSSSVNGVKLFQHCTYGGYAVTLTPGNYTLSQLQALGVVNDDVSSVKVPAGYQVVLYWEDNFLGTSLSLASDDDCLVDNGWNDKATSAKVTKISDTPNANQTWTLNELPADSYRDDEVTRYFQRDDSSLGSVAWDQGSSIPLTWGANAGKVLWVTQDAWDGNKLQANKKFNCSDFFSYNNSIIIQQNKNDWTPDDPNMTINSPMGRPKQICSNQPGTNWSWPSNGVEIGDKVYMVCGEGNGLSGTNQSLYMLTQNSGTLWASQRTTPAGMSGQTAIDYAGGMVKASDGYVYVFGSQATGYGYNRNAHVARFPVSNPMSWTFWNGSSWTSAPTTGNGARITDAYGTLAMNYVNGKYVMVTMDQGFNCDNTRNIYTATSNSPTGPFTNKTMVYKINDYFQGQFTRYYTPNIHPQFVNGRNELLITYSVNQSACGVNDCINGFIDPNYYRVRGIRIPYSKIGL